MDGFRVIGSRFVNNTCPGLTEQWIQARLSKHLDTGSQRSILLPYTFGVRKTAFSYRRFCRSLDLSSILEFQTSDLQKITLPNPHPELLNGDSFLKYPSMHSHSSLHAKD